MDWSKEEKVVLDEMCKMPAFSLTSQQRYEMYQVVQKEALQMRKVRRRKIMLGSLAGVAAAVVLTFGVMNQSIVTEWLNGTVSYTTGGTQEQTTKVTLEYEVQVPSGDRLTDEERKALVSGLEQRLHSTDPIFITSGFDGKEILSIELSAEMSAEQQAELHQRILEPPKLELRGPDGQVLAAGKEFIKGAYVEERNGRYEVVTEFANVGQIANLTRPHIDKEISIWLDDQVIMNMILARELGAESAVIANLQHDAAVQLVNNLNFSIFPYKLVEKPTP